MTRVSKDGTNGKKSGSRSERLAAALRENLRRRKAQERGRCVAGRQHAKKAVPDSAQ